MRDIKTLREDIDDIDRQLVALFEKRMHVVEEVAAYKNEKNLPLKDPNRESSLIEKNVQLLEHKKYAKFLHAFFKDMMEYSRNYQKELIRTPKVKPLKSFESAHVGYQGIEGSFSSIALTQYFGPVEARLAYPKFEDIFEALHKEEIEYGILPIENSSTGAINEVYDLMRLYEIQIVGDYYLPIRHHLIGHSSAKIDQIRAVYSHEQGFKQSRQYLKDKSWELFNHFNTAKSVKYVKDMADPSLVAIGSKEAAQVYGLSVLETDIQDHDFNSTRFVVIARDKYVAPDANKISMILRLSHEPQALYRVLACIARHNINMHKLESRPVMERPWEYCFYIDLEGHLQDPEVQGLLSEMRQESRDIMVLGNYHSRNGVE